jgi:hypothetical protein
MNSRPTVLIFTYPEYGQANVNLATSYELALAGVNVYIASFLSLSTRVSRLQELIDRHASRSNGKPVGSVIFHECKGITPYSEAVEKHGLNVANAPHPPGLSGASESYSRLGPSLFPWGPEEYLAAIATCKDIIATTKPDVVGVDPHFFAAQDACKLADQKFMVISPTGIKEAAVNVQPYLAAFWKYPVSVVESVFDTFSSTNSRPVQFIVGTSISSQVVADSHQHVSLHSTRYTHNDLGGHQINRSFTWLPWAQESVWWQTAQTSGWSDMYLSGTH